jgi:hypothetical protein
MRDIFYWYVVFHGTSSVAIVLIGTPWIDEKYYKGRLWKLSLQGSPIPLSKLLYKHYKNCLESLYRRLHDRPFDKIPSIGDFIVTLPAREASCYFSSSVNRI